MLASQEKVKKDTHKMTEPKTYCMKDNHTEKKFAIHILNDTYLEYRVHMNQ